MKQGFCPLASGSKGNTIYFSSGNTHLLIDCGLSLKTIEQRLGPLNVGIDQIQAILISHEHTDHISGLKSLALKHDIPVLANSDTARGIWSAFRELPRFKIFTTGETFIFEDIEIHPFSVLHDGADPVAFTLKTMGGPPSTKVGVCTDLGFVTPLVRRSLIDSDFLYIEANHEPSMVHACSRPQSYKDRVLGRSGHLSNEACADLLASVLHTNLRHIHLAHLSEECNNPLVALQKVQDKIGKSIPITVALQDRACPFVTF